MDHEGTKDTKRKGKPAMRGWSCLKILALIIGTVVGGFFLLVVSVHFLFWSGSIKPSLDTEFIPAAEYLLANPQPTPQRENVGQFYNNSNNDLCIAVTHALHEKQDVSFLWSEIFINHQRVGREDMSTHLLTSLPGKTVFCVENTLNTGLHIIEFRARGDWRQHLFSQQWAIEVE